jgi:UDP-glucose 4-epimerase
MKLLVTGGAGYIGSVIVEHLLAGGHEVLVVDDLRNGHRAALAPQATWLCAPFESAECAALLAAEKPDAVVHMAAYSLVEESMRDPTRYFANNLSATLKLLEAVVQAGVARFVFSSSAAVYARAEELPMTESHHLEPQSAYGETKLAVERALPWFERAHGLGWISLRYFNAAGASPRLGEWHVPETHLIPLALEAARSGRPLRLFGDDYPTPDGTCIRDYVHVLDLAEAHLLAAEKAGQGGGRSLNLGAGHGHSNREVLNTVETVTGRRVVVAVAARRAGDQTATVASNQAAERDLGWRPRRDLREVVESAWYWREEHPRGYSSPVAPPPSDAQPALPTISDFQGR